MHLQRLTQIPNIRDHSFVLKEGKMFWELKTDYHCDCMSFLRTSVSPEQERRVWKMLFLTLDSRDKGVYFSEHLVVCHELYQSQKASLEQNCSNCSFAKCFTSRSAWQSAQIEFVVTVRRNVGGPNWVERAKDFMITWCQYLHVSMSKGEWHFSGRISLAILREPATNPGFPC
jgi:hypothetical protein